MLIYNSIRANYAFISLWQFGIWDSFTFEAIPFDAKAVDERAVNANANESKIAMNLFVNVIFAPLSTEIVLLMLLDSINVMSSALEAPFLDS